MLEPRSRDNVNAWKPGDEDELEQCVTEEWEIPQETCANLVRDYKKEAVVR